MKREVQFCVLYIVEVGERIAGFRKVANTEAVGYILGFRINKKNELLKSKADQAALFSVLLIL
jgi:hypothetical protein